MTSPAYATADFFKGSAVCVAVSGLLMAPLVHWVPIFRPYGLFSALTVGIFLVFAAGVYFMGASALRSKSKLAFNNVILSSVLAKLIVALLFLFIYKKTAQPTDGFFTVLFFIAYAIFTYFEVHFLSRLARS